MSISIDNLLHASAPLPVKENKADKIFLFSLVSIMLFLAGCGMSVWISILQNESKIKSMRDRVTLEVDEVCNNITRIIYSAVNLTQGISALVKVKGGITNEEFDSLSSELLKEQRGIIRNTVLAPDNVIRYIYPYKGNERALGLDYKKVPDQIEGVRLAIRERKTIVAGPINLVQGGRGIVGRTPIFISGRFNRKISGDSLYYWGIAATVIHFDSLLGKSGLIPASKKHDLALRGVNGSGAKGDVFWGDSSVFDRNPVLLDIVLPYGSWQLAAIPGKGWGKYDLSTSVSFWIGLSVSFLLSFLLFTTLYINSRKAEEVARRKAAEYADRLKSAFLATMSHELRTPLNSIIGFTGILLQGMVGELNDEQKKQLSMVQQSAAHLLELINDVLDISRIEAGQIDLYREHFSLYQSLERAVQMVKSAAERKGLSFSVDIVECPQALYGDRRRFEQILINLFNNAVKFTEKGGIKVTVDMRKSGETGVEQLTYGEDNIYISVSDSGIGMRKEEIATLFKPFRQIDTGLARKYEGTGLGLSISKKLANLMGGDISAFSEGPGKGSTFTLILPQKGA